MDYNDHSENIEIIFQKQIDLAQKLSQETFDQQYKRRVQNLNLLEKIILQNQQNIRDALMKDFKKPFEETDATEIIPVLTELKHNRSRLKKWMKHKKVKTPLLLLGSSSKIMREAKGVVLIIAPWNFPLNLAIIPLISALAAGNCVTIKPSEHTPNISKLLSEILSEIFDSSEVAVIEGGIPESQELLNLPFHHIFVTGSPELGKIVMTKAAKNLSSVTLELGGKSPSIVDDSADIKNIAKRMAWGKFMNNGQICVSPDHCFVQANIKDQFLKAFTDEVKNMYGHNPEESDSFSRIINNRHFNRIKGLIDEAIENGADSVLPLKFNEDDCFIAPTILTNVSLDSKIMKEEIFGPVLPIITFQKLDEVINIINSSPRPLALYMNSTKTKDIQKVCQQVKSGAFTVNHNIVHLFNSNLPFGGINNSGIGASHGEFGFLEFTHQKAVFYQWFPIAASQFITPPFTDLRRKILYLVQRLF
ncbi:MAG: aldehyde dehydrogenase family protein [Bacteriovoracaceae bacterium]|jgi:aldehyde dehydrogenase (NAD+)|nr:aldehyde dehydrogenase family protein [Bacteriovoracaceae bacterium]